MDWVTPNLGRLPQGCGSRAYLYTTYLCREAHGCA